MTLQARLHELCLRSDDCHRLARFYTQSLGYAFTPADDGMLGVARDRRLRIVPGAARTLGAAVFAVEEGDQLAALADRLRAADVTTHGTAWDGLEPGSFGFSDPDGNRYVFGIPMLLEPATVNGAATRPARLQHVVFASTDAERLALFFVEVVGFRLSDRVLDEKGALRTAFMRCSHEHHSLAVFAASECRLDHHCYEAGDWGLIRDWADHFSDGHVPLKWGPGRHGPGNNLFLFIHDVDGNWVEVSAELEHVEADRSAGVWPHEERTLNSWGIGLLRS
jgi:catechol-2,3-dioxygenase